MHAISKCQSVSAESCSSKQCNLEHDIVTLFVTEFGVPSSVIISDFISEASLHFVAFRF